MRAGEVYACSVADDPRVIACEGFRFTVQTDDPAVEGGWLGRPPVRARARLDDRGELQLELFCAAASRHAAGYAADDREGARLRPDRLETLGEYHATWEGDADPVAAGSLVAVHTGPLGLVRVSCPLAEALMSLLNDAKRAAAGARDPQQVVDRVEAAVRRADPTAYAAFSACGEIVLGKDPVEPEDAAPH